MTRGAEAGEKQLFQEDLTTTTSLISLQNALGLNMAQVNNSPDLFAIYGGDVNKD